VSASLGNIVPGGQFGLSRYPSGSPGIGTLPNPLISAVTSAIAASAAAKPLLDTAGVKPDAGVTDLGKAFTQAAAKRFYDREPSLRDLA